MGVEEQAEERLSHHHIDWWLWLVLAAHPGQMPC
jgi:hypothetical protein